MRILYLHQYFNTPAQSGSTRSYEMARRLVGFGHDVHVITSGREHRGGAGWTVSTEAGVTVHWRNVPYSNHMSDARRILAFAEFAAHAGRRAAKVGGDLVFASSTPLTIALPGVWAAGRLRVPMVFEVRDLWPELPIAVGALRSPITVAAARALERFAYRNSSRIVALSPGMRDGIVKTGYPADRVAIIPNSADIETFAVDPAAVASFRAGLPWLGSRQLVVYAGTLGRINGVAYLAEVAARVREINPEVRFLVVGGGAEESLVRSVAARLGVLDSTFFMLPKLPKTEMPALFGAADVGCSLFVDLPEMWSNSANKFFDSLAAGKPVAINYGGWQAEILRTTSAGIVLPPRDYRLAARMLADFLNNPTRLHDASAASGRLAVEQFARDRLAVDLDETLTSARDDYDKRAAAR